MPTPSLSSPSPRRSRRVRRLAAAALLLGVASLPAQAFYKIVGPDGRVTYTDRPTAPGRVVPMESDGRVAGDPALPAELSRAMARFPVTLYVAPGCQPCDEGRRLLQDRGIPYAERRVTTVEDSEALMQLTGGREAPVLAIGQQLLRGLSAEQWNTYLDAAGYPSASMLPANYRYPPAQPLVAAPEPAPAAAPATTLPHLPLAAPPGRGGIRF